MGYRKKNWRPGYGVRLYLLLIMMWVGSRSILNGQCFTVIAGRDTTVDGSVMVAHNEGMSGRFFVDIRKVGFRKHSMPGFIELKNHGTLRQVAGTFGYLWFEVPGTDFGDTYMNENGVVVCSNESRSREDRKDLSDGGIGFMLRRVVAERAVSSRHGVEIGGRLIERYGYYSSGRVYSIVDSREAWVLCVIKGKRWVAQRVPDDQVVVISNRFPLHGFDLSDNKNVMASPDIISYAQARKWYDPGKSEFFDFSVSYSSRESLTAESNIGREWRAITLLSRLDVQPGDIGFPFSFKPKRKIKPVDLFRILRDQNEDTPYEGKPGVGICQVGTCYSFVAQLRSYLPVEVGYLVWVCPGRPDVNAYLPWYLSIESSPEGYAHGMEGDLLSSHFRRPKSYFSFHPDYIYWWCERLALSVPLGDQRRSRIVGKDWDNFENFVMKVLKRREKEFVYMVKKSKTVGLKIITNYVHHQEYRRWFQVMELLERLN